MIISEKVSSEPMTLFYIENIAIFFYFFSLFIWSRSFRFVIRWTVRVEMTPKQNVNVIIFINGNDWVKLLCLCVCVCVYLRPMSDVKWSTELCGLKQIFPNAYNILTDIMTPYYYIHWVNKQLAHRAELSPSSRTTSAQIHIHKYILNLLEFSLKTKKKGEKSKITIITVPTATINRKTREKEWNIAKTAILD